MKRESHTQGRTFTQRGSILKPIEEEEVDKMENNFCSYPSDAFDEFRLIRNKLAKRNKTKYKSHQQKLSRN